MQLYYLAIERDFKGTESGAGYNRLSIWKLNNYHIAKFYIDKTLNHIFEYEYPIIKRWYSEKECQINYPIIITNDYKLNQAYRNVFSLEEFDVYCNGEEVKTFFIKNVRDYTILNSVKPIPLKIFELGFSGEKIFELVKTLLATEDFTGFESCDPNVDIYKESTDNYYESYDSDLLNEFISSNDNYFSETLREEYESGKN